MIWQISRIYEEKNDHFFTSSSSSSASSIFSISWSGASFGTSFPDSSALSSDYNPELTLVVIDTLSELSIFESSSMFFCQSGSCNSPYPNCFSTHSS